MNPAFVTSSVSRDAGGLFFAMTKLAGSLHASGVQSEVYGLKDTHSGADGSAWHPVPCHMFDRHGPSALGYSPKLAAALCGSPHDLLHTHGIWQWPSAAVHAWHRKSGKPYLVSPHGMLDPWALAQSRWKKRMVSVWYETKHLREATCIHALCQSEAVSIRSYGLKSPICLIPNGVDPAEPRDKPEAGRKKQLLFLGRLHPKKGLSNTLRAWNSVRQMAGSGHWQLVIAGWDQGGHESDLKLLCREIGLLETTIPADQFLAGLTAADLPASVIFVGPVFGQKKEALLRSSDAFILPSFSEGLPMSVLEAWSYGLPVVMTDECNLPEGFVSHAAIRITPDVAGVTHGLVNLVQATPAELHTMGENGLRLARDKFSWSSVASQLREVYGWVLGGGPKPGTVITE